MKICQEIIQIILYKSYILSIHLAVRLIYRANIVIINLIEINGLQDTPLPTIMVQVESMRTNSVLRGHYFLHNASDFFVSHLFSPKRGFTMILRICMPSEEIKKWRGALFIPKTAILGLTSEAYKGWLRALRTTGSKDSL